MGRARNFHREMYKFVVALTCSPLQLDVDVLRLSSVVCMKSVRRSFVPFAVGIVIQTNCPGVSPGHHGLSCVACILPWLRLIVE
eukprot:10106246-Ditylum_brightwellii.AAC.1